MGKVERQIEALAAHLNMESRISLAQGMALLDVSETTVRRLFARMDEAGLALRVHGGIQSIGIQKANSGISEAQRQKNMLKYGIAQAALDYVGNARTVYLDSGDIVFQFCQVLAEKMRAGSCGVTNVVTNSFRVSQVLSRITNIQCIGGQYRESRQDCCGYLAEEALQSLSIDVCFLSADGCNLEHGFSFRDMETARLGKLAVKRSMRRIALIDSAKFGCETLVTYARIKDFNAIVTDGKLDSSIADRLRAKGAEVRLAR